jgi:hypothetical protein
LVLHSYNLSTWEAEARGSGTSGQSGLYRETLPQNKNNNKQQTTNQARTTKCILVPELQSLEDSLKSMPL